MTASYLTYGGPFLAPTRNPFNYAKFEQISRDNTTTWLTLEECTQQLNLFNDESQDTYISSLELATRQAIEDYLGLSIFATQYRAYYDANALYGIPLALDLPVVGISNVPAATGVTINSVKYWTSDSPPVLVVVDPTTYVYDPSGNKIVLQSLPTNINYFLTSPIEAVWTTAASPLASYPVIKQAGLLLLTHLYNNRSNSVDSSIRDIPFGVDTLLRPYKPLVM